MEGAIKLYPIIIDIYTELYKQLTVRSKLHTYTPSKQNQLLICKFIGWLKKTYKPHQISVEFLIDFFEFQFNRYIGVKTKFGSNAININWIIGPKAIQTWEQRNINKKRFIKYRVSKNCQLRLSKMLLPAKMIKVNIVRTNMLSGLNQQEEVEKERYYNKHVGYLHCASMTTLYHPQSVWCTGCQFKEECIQRLQRTYQNIYKLRLA